MLGKGRLLRQRMLLQLKLKQLDKAAVLHCDCITVVQSKVDSEIAFTQRSELLKFVFRSTCVFGLLFVTRFSLRGLYEYTK